MYETSRLLGRSPNLPPSPRTRSPATGSGLGATTYLGTESRLVENRLVENRLVEHRWPGTPSRLPCRNASGSGCC